MVCLNLNNEVGFIGKVSNDEFGQKYEDGLKKENVRYLYSKKMRKITTGTCLILITPDSERTMCTFLGTAGKISENDIDEEEIKNSKMTFLEGYLWDKGDPKKHLIKLLKTQIKLQCRYQIYFCVERHKSSFLELVKNKIDIIFANEQIMSLIDAQKFEEVIYFAKEVKKRYNYYKR